MRHFFSIFLLVSSTIASAGELFEDNGLVYRINDSDTNTVCLVYTAMETNNLTVPSTAYCNGCEKTVTEIGDTEDFFDCVIENIPNDPYAYVYLQLPKTIKRLNGKITSLIKRTFITFEAGNEVDYICDELCDNTYAYTINDAPIPLIHFSGLCAGENFKFPQNFSFGNVRKFTISPKNKYYQEKQGCLFMRGVKSFVVCLMPSDNTDNVFIPKEVTNIVNARLGCYERFYEPTDTTIKAIKSNIVIEDGSQLKMIADFGLSYCSFQKFFPKECKTGKRSFHKSEINFDITFDSFENITDLNDCTFNNDVEINCDLKPRLFSGCIFNADVTFKSNAKIILENSFEYSEFKNRLVFPDSIYFYNYAFKDCLFNKGLSMENCKLYDLGYYAFDGAVARESSIIKLPFGGLYEFIGDDIELYWEGDARNNYDQYHEKCYWATLPHVTTLHFTSPILNHIDLLFGPKSNDLKRVILAAKTPPYGRDGRLVSEEYTKPHTEVIDGKTHYFPSAYDKVIIYVPKGSLEAYKNSQYWKKFTHIIEYDNEENINYNYEILGDTNLDGITDVKDITRLIACIIGGENDNSGFADVNNDGIVDVKDVTALINLILQ